MCDSSARRDTGSRPSPPALRVAWNSVCSRKSPTQWQTRKTEKASTQFTRARTYQHFATAPQAATVIRASQTAAEGEKSLRGKSGHRRARWAGSRPGETRGKVPQKHTADGARSRGGRTGKGEKVR